MSVGRLGTAAEPDPVARLGGRAVLAPSLLVGIGALSRTISLSVIRHLASRPEQRIGSLFFNRGGPGSFGVDALRIRTTPSSSTGPARGRFDVVSCDPRGTGASTRVRCFADPRARERFWGDLVVPTTPAASRRSQRKAVAYGRRCAAASGDLLEHLSTADTVRDLDTCGAWSAMRG